MDKDTNNNVNKITYSIFGILFCSTLFAFLMLINNHVSATACITDPETGKEVCSNSKSATASVNVSAACTMSATNTTHAATLTPGVFTGNIGSSNITAICNDPLGFAIYAIGYSNNEYGNTALVDTSGNTSSNTNSDTTSNTIAAGTATNGDTSSWSMKLGKSNDSNVAIVTTPTNYSDYAPVPATYTKVATYPTNTTRGTESSFTTTYGVYPSPTQAPGTYTGAVRYTLVHPNNAISQDKYYMQDFTLSMCEVLASNNPITIYDKRDEEPYLVQYLKDGNCWMLDNLRLGSNEEAIALSPLDTNIKEPWTLPQSGTECFSNDFCTSTSGAIGTGMTVPAINSSYKDNVGVVSFGYGSGKIGVYYNYCALSGGTYCYSWGQGVGDAKYDICPSKWRLPTSGDNGEFQHLYATYGDATSFNRAFSTVLSGSFGSEGQMNLDKRGIFPSSTNYNGSLMYGLYVQSGTVLPADYLTGDRYRFVGNTARCLLDD